MIVSVPASAAAAPPEMPASTNADARAPRARRGSDRRAGAAVLRSTMTWPGRALSSSPPSPSTTSSTTVLSGSERNTRSQRAAELGDRARRRDARGRRPARRCGRSPTTACPASRIRRAIRPPMLPRPIIPLVVRGRPSSRRSRSSDADRLAGAQLAGARVKRSATSGSWPGTTIAAARSRTPSSRS